MFMADCFLEIWSPLDRNGTICMEFFLVDRRLIKTFKFKFINFAKIKFKFIDFVKVKFKPINNS